MKILDSSAPAEVEEVTLDIELVIVLAGMEKLPVGEIMLKLEEREKKEKEGKEEEEEEEALPLVYRCT